jgi:hypothetical protein
MAPQAAMGLAELPNLKMMSKQQRVRREIDKEKYFPHPSRARRQPHSSQRRLWRILTQDQVDILFAHHLGAALSLLQQILQARRIAC